MPPQGLLVRRAGVRGDGARQQSSQDRKAPKRSRYACPTREQPNGSSKVSSGEPRFVRSPSIGPPPVPRCRSPDPLGRQGYHSRRGDARAQGDRRPERAGFADPAFHGRFAHSHVCLRSPRQPSGPRRRTPRRLENCAEIAAQDGPLRATAIAALKKIDPSRSVSGFAGLSPVGMFGTRVCCSAISANSTRPASFSGAMRFGYAVVFVRYFDPEARCCGLTSGGPQRDHRHGPAIEYAGGHRRCSCPSSSIAKDAPVDSFGDSTGPLRGLEGCSFGSSPARGWLRLVAGLCASSALADDASPSVDKLIERLAAKDLNTRREAGYQLAHLGAAAKPAVPALVKAINDDDKQVWSYAIAALAALGPDAQEAIPVLIDHLDGRKGRGRRDRDLRQGLMRTAYTLSRIGLVAVPPLIEALGQSDDTLRAGAAPAPWGAWAPRRTPRCPRSSRIWRKIRTSSATKPFRLSLSSVPTRVRRWSRRCKMPRFAAARVRPRPSLQMDAPFRGDAKEISEQAVAKENDPTVRAALLAVLPRSGVAPDRCVELILPAVTDENEALRHAALNALLASSAVRQAAVPKLGALLQGWQPRHPGGLPQGRSGASVRMRSTHFPRSSKPRVRRMARPLTPTRWRRSVRVRCRLSLRYCRTANPMKTEMGAAHLPHLWAAGGASVGGGVEER